MLHDALQRLASEYAFQRAKPFAKSVFGNFVRHDIAMEAKRQISFLPYDLKVKSSVGAGNWASVPWLGFFDPLITESATMGFYVVYLINPQTRRIYLSMNQGTPAVYRELGESRDLKSLERTAVLMTERIVNFAKQFDRDPIDLGSQDSLPKGYMAGHAFGREYESENLNQELFYNDLEKMLAAYSSLIDKGGTTPAEVMLEESGTHEIEESRKYILSRRIERAPNVRLPVLKKRGATCEACGLDPIKTYGYKGVLKNTPLDVHHAKPIFHLAEGESKRYKIPDDFIVLCPTCHRVIHKQNDPSDLAELKRSISNRFMPGR